MKQKRGMRRSKTLARWQAGIADWIFQISKEELEGSAGWKPALRRDLLQS
jgi:hypothetical protein